MAKSILILFLVFGGIYLYQGQKKLARQTASTESATKASLSCKGKESCGLIYVAPWCPGCKQAAPSFKGFLENAKNNPRFGLTIIVGRGEPAANQEEAAFYGDGAVVDADNSRFAALGIRQYPSFFVVNKEGQVTHQNQAAMQLIVQNLLRPNPTP